MTRIAIITDTDSSLPADLAGQYGIHQVPVYVNFGSETLRTGVDIDDASLFKRVDQVGKLPTTSAPAPGDFAAAYEAAFQAGADAVLCFTVSSVVSAIYSSAQTAAGLFPAKNIRVVDTLSLSMGQGFMVLAAAQAVRDGADLDAAVAHALDVRSRTHLFAGLATLKYLAMSGRVGHVAAGIAGLLDVRPILTIKEGKLDMLERSRTQKKAYARMVELFSARVQGKAVESLAILHVNAEDDAKAFQAQLCAALPCPPLVYHVPLTAALSVHTGAGAVGAALVLSK